MLWERILLKQKQKHSKKGKIYYKTKGKNLTKYYKSGLSKSKSGKTNIWGILDAYTRLKVPKNTTGFITIQALCSQRRPPLGLASNKLSKQNFYYCFPKTVEDNNQKTKKNYCCLLEPFLILNI